MAQAESLFSQLSKLLGLERPSSEQPAPVPADLSLSAKGMAALTQGSRLLAFASQLLKEHEQPIAALRIAVVSPAIPSAEKRQNPRKSALPARLGLMLPAVISLLAQDQRAARMASSLLVRYDEATVELRRLEQALALGQMDDLEVDQARGKFFFLTKIGQILRDFPLLAALFNLPTQERPKLPAIRTQPVPNQTLKDDEIVVRRAIYLLDCMEMKMLILQTAFDILMSDEPNTTSHGASLPYPSQKTAVQLSSFMRLNPILLSRVRDALSCYRNVRMLIRQRPISDLEAVKSALASLTALPYQFANNPILASMFPRAGGPRSADPSPFATSAIGP